jgi:hypothetical protein
MPLFLGLEDYTFNEYFIHLNKGRIIMKRISSLLIGTSLVFMASSVIAAGSTSLDANWTCKTNASSSSNDADKQADKQMSKNAKSASEAFNYAAQNCRNCTKITCETNN